MKMRIKILVLPMLCMSLTVSGCSGENNDIKNSNLQMEETKKEDTVSKVSTEAAASEVAESSKENIQNTDYDFKYNPYVLSNEFLIKYGDEYLDFYKGFVNAYINYETSCPCPKEEYSYDADTLKDSNFMMFQTDAYFDYENVDGIYDKETKTLHWNYKSNTKEEHDRKIKEFEDQIATYMQCLRKDDNDFEKTIALYGEFNSRMKYNKDQKDKSSYNAIMNGTGKCTSFSWAYCHLLLEAGVDCVSNGGFSKKSGGHRWDIVRLDEKDYFMDPTYEVGSKGSGGKGLLYFGMSSEERDTIGGFTVNSTFYGDVNGLKTGDYVNSDGRFSELRNCVDFKLDRDRECIVYYNRDDSEPKEFYYNK